MFVRTASERDLQAVRALLVETWHATYDQIYGVERVTAITDDWHSLAVLKRRLDRPNAEFLVADDGKQLGGMAYAAVDAVAGFRAVRPHRQLRRRAVGHPGADIRAQEGRSLTMRAQRWPLPSVHADAISVTMRRLPATRYR